MKTKRKYAHELYPHPGEYEVRPLEVEVPYLYAQAFGWSVWGTGWFDAFPGGHEKGSTEYAAAAQMTSYRTLLLIAARQRALLADALLQGLSGQDAWEWAESRLDEDGGWTYERAEHYGINSYAIKPYSCGPEPDHHDHRGNESPGGGHFITRIDGKESECVECCEEEGSTS